MSSSASPPQKKKAKLDRDASSSVEEAAAAAWEHYRNYIDSSDNNEDGEGDTDELEEMIHEVLLKPHRSALKPLTSLSELSAAAATLSTHAMLPILISVGYYHLADIAISECLEFQQQDQQQDQEQENDTTQGKQEKTKLIEKCQELIEESLHWYPENASMWSMGANFGRMLQVISPSTVCQWYERAVQSAVQVRTTTLSLLEDEDCPEQVKEWLELLMLNQVAGVEYVVNEDDDDEEEENSENGTKKNDKDEEDIENDKEEEDEGYFSASSIEAMARFMVAMLNSTAGQHDSALSHLQHFPVTHRVHPKVWQPKDNDIMTVSSKGTPHPVKYQCQAGNQGILPEATYQRLCQLFAPEAAYWRESDYNHRGYYSYYMDKPSKLEADRTTEKGFVPGNLLEDVIWNHFYPLIEEQVSAQSTGSTEEDNTPICGAEWWVHTRPVKANLGHNLHFDTDEALLAQESVITHPLYSSVMYLTGGSKAQEGGATIVFDQTPDSAAVASRAWRCVPEDNSFLIFPGNMLHGVLPCPGSNPSNGDKDQSQAVVNEKTSDVTKDTIQKQWIPSVSESSEVPHRLTFLVGFWTRRVPDKMKNRKLYGPCGPIPPRPSEASSGGKDADPSFEGMHTWVDEVYEGYESKDGTASATGGHPQTNLLKDPLPCISPAWETIEPVISNGSNSGKGGESALLEIPMAIDHRFFVRGAPKCFRDSLFERTKDDEEDDEEEDEEEC